MDSRWCDSDRKDWKPGKFEVSRKINSENAPPAIISLAMKVNNTITGPRGPSSSLGHQNTFGRLRFMENNNISVELVKFTAPRSRPVGRDGYEFSGARNSRAIID